LLLPLLSFPSRIGVLRGEAFVFLGIIHPMRSAFQLLLASLAVSCGAGATPPPENYTSLCAICHLPGIAGAPKVDDTANWARRARSGLSMLYCNALEGIPNTAMKDER